MDVAYNSGRVVTRQFTRPADTNVYAIGDVINDSTSAPVATTLQFSGLCRGQNPFGLLQSATIISSNNGTPKPDLLLYLFDSIVALQNDNAPFTPSDAELANLLHVIAFPAAAWLAANASAGAAGNTFCNAQNLQLPLKPDSPALTVYAILVANNAYTPASAEQFTIRLGMLD